MVRLERERFEAYGRLGLTGRVGTREKQYWDNLQQVDGNYLLSESQKEVARKLADESNIVLITELADYPTPVGGVIQLVDDTIYMQVAPVVNIGVNTFVFGLNSVIKGLHETLTDLVYTGTGTMITTVDTSLVIESITILAQTATQIFDWSSPGSGGRSILLRQLFTRAPKVGSIQDVFVFDAFQCAFQDLTTGGFTFADQNDSISFSEILADITGGDFVALGTSTFNFLDYRDTTVVNIAGTLLSGATASANVNTGGLGILRDNVILNFAGGATLDGNIKGTDNLWRVRDTTGTTNTRIGAYLNTTGFDTTTITDIGVPVLISSTWSEKIRSQTTTTAAGRITNTSGDTMALDITLIVSMRPASGNNISCSAFIALDGTIESESSTTLELAGNREESLTVRTRIDVPNGSFIEGFVSNNDSTANIEITKAIIDVA